jgi:Glycosyltransferase
MVLVEAFANGLPVVASRLGSMAEIVRDGLTGIHFEAGSPDDLAEKVKWMYEHPDECKRMGLNARRAYEEKYTPERNYKILSSIYNETVKENNYQAIKNKAGIFCLCVLMQHHMIKQ